MRDVCRFLFSFIFLASECHFLKAETISVERRVVSYTAEEHAVDKSAIKLKFKIAKCSDYGSADSIHIWAKKNNSGAISFETTIPLQFSGEYGFASVSLGGALLKDVEAEAIFINYDEEHSRSYKVIGIDIEK